MVRCEQCGYQNQDGIQKCVKCRNPLGAKESVSASRAEGAASQSTQADIKFNREAWDGNGKTRDIEVDESQSLANTLIDSNKTQIYRSSKQKSKVFTLIALSEDRTQNLRTIPVKGEEVNLNRELLDDGNTTISRSGHAKIVFRDGSWWLENLSSLKTTYVQVNRPLKIENGDEIIIGDSLFRFSEEA